MCAFYKRRRATLGTAFADFVDKLLAETRVSAWSDIAAQWRVDVAAERAAS